jgi:hypothetical protein
MNENKITIVNKELYNSTRIFNVELIINNKEVEISITENYYENTDNYQIDWEILNNVDLTDEEMDIIDNYANEVLE